MLGQLRRGVSGISRRLIASYVLVTVAVVVLVEVFVFGYQVPRLVNDAQLNAQVRGSAANFWGQLSQRYPTGVPAGDVLGDTGQRPDPGTAQTTPDGSTLIVPAISGPITSHKAVTAIVAITQDGTIIASSAPSRYPPGQSAATELPASAARSITTGKLKGASGGPASTQYGSVTWTLYSADRAGADAAIPGDGSQPRALTYLYLQAPRSTGFINPIRAWGQLRALSGSGPLSEVFYALLIAVIPLGILLGCWPPTNWYVGSAS